MELTKYERGALYLLKQIAGKLELMARGNYSVEEAAAYLGIGVTSLRQLRKDGLVRPVLLTKSKSKRARLAYRRVELDRFQEENQEQDPQTTGGKDMFEEER